MTPLESKLIVVTSDVFWQLRMTQSQVYIFSERAWSACMAVICRKTSTTICQAYHAYVQVHIFCERALSRLRGSDRELPQIRRLREMLGRGLAVHHAGVSMCTC